MIQAGARYAKNAGAVFNLNINVCLVPKVSVASADWRCPVPVG
jgi:hypothetical protein